MIKSQLLVECIQDLLEVFDENETEVLESIKKACNEMLLRMHMGPGLHIFDPTDIYVVSRVPNTSKLSSPSSVSTLDDYCVETSFLITGIRDAEDIRKVVYRNFFGADRVNVYRIQSKYTYGRLRDQIKEEEYNKPTCVYVDPWQLDEIAKVLSMSHVEYFPTYYENL